MERNNPYMQYVENKDEEIKNGDKGTDATADLQTISKSDEDSELKASNKKLNGNKILTRKKWYDFHKNRKRDKMKCEQYKPTQSIRNRYISLCPKSVVTPKTVVNIVDDQILNANNSESMNPSDCVISEKVASHINSEVMSPEKTNENELKYQGTACSGKDVNNAIMKGKKFRSYIKTKNSKDTEASLDYELKKFNEMINSGKHKLYKPVLSKKYSEKFKSQLQKKNRKTSIPENPKNPVIEEQELTFMKAPIANKYISRVEKEPPNISLLNSTRSSNNELTSDQNVTNSEENIETENTPALSKTLKHIANQKSLEYPIPLDIIMNEDSRRHDENICLICIEKEAMYVCARCKKMAYCSRKCQKKDWARHSEKCEVQTVQLLQSRNLKKPQSGKILKRHSFADGIRSQMKSCVYNEGHFAHFSNNSSTLTTQQHTLELKDIKINHGDRYSYRMETYRYESIIFQKHNGNVCKVCMVEQANFVCAGCQKNSYCSRTCQVIDWEYHSENCYV